MRRRLTKALAAVLADNKIVVFPTTHAVPLRRDATLDAQMSYRALALRLLSARPPDTIELAGPMPARVATALGLPSRDAFLSEYRRRTTAVRAAYTEHVK